MKITEQWLKKESACLEGISWFNKQEERDGVEVMKRLITEEQLSWANWLCVRLMTHKQQIQYAVYNVNAHAANFTTGNYLNVFQDRYQIIVEIPNVRLLHEVLLLHGPQVCNK